MKNSNNFQNKQALISEEVYRNSSTGSVQGEPCYKIEFNKLNAQQIYYIWHFTDKYLALKESSKEIQDLVLHDIQELHKFI